MITGSIMFDLLAIFAIGWYVAGAILWLPIGRWMGYGRNCKKHGKDQAERSET